MNCSAAKNLSAEGVCWTNFNFSEIKNVFFYIVQRIVQTIFLEKMPVKNSNVIFVNCF